MARRRRWRQRDTAGADAIKTQEEEGDLGVTALLTHTDSLSIVAECSQIDLIVLKEEREVDPRRH